MKAIVSFLLVAVLAFQPLFAQQGEKSGSDVYSRIEKMISKQRYTDAYNTADSLRAAAMSRARAGQAVGRIVGVDVTLVVNQFLDAGVGIGATFLALLGKQRTACQHGNQKEREKRFHGAKYYST